MKEEFNEIKLSDTIPDISCVYLLLNNQELCYVGQTICLKKRISSHKRKIKEFNELFDSIFFIEIEDYTERMMKEREIIEELEPKWNYASSCFNPPVPLPIELQMKNYVEGWRPDPHRFETYSQR